MLEETANKSVTDFLKILLRKASAICLNFVKKEVKRISEPNKTESLRKLVRKNPGQGVNTEILESKEMAAYVERHLKKFNVDFYMKHNKKDNIYSVSTTKNNKDLVDIFQKEFKEKQAAKAASYIAKGEKSRKHRPLDKSIALAQKAAENYNKQHENDKHKELTGNKDNRVL